MAVEGLYDLFQQIGKLWTAKNLSAFVTGGVYAFEAPEGTSMPYCVMTAGSEYPFSFTNSSVYSKTSVDFIIYALTWDEIGKLVPIVSNTLKDTPLMLSTGTLVLLRPRGRSFVWYKKEQMFRGSTSVEIIYGVPN